MKNLFLYAAVAITGAAAFTLVLLGMRCLIPFAGKSQFLFHSLLLISILAYSTGMMIGGWIHGRNPGPGAISFLLGCAGIWIIIIPWLRHPFLQLASPLGFRNTILLFSGVFILPPFLLFGIVVPFAVRIRASFGDPILRISVRMTALHLCTGAIAVSVCGFFIIPLMGIGKLTVAIGIMLIIIAFSGTVLLRRSKQDVLLTILFFISACVVWSATTDRTSSSPDLVSVEQSRYSELRVIDRNGIRYFMIDGGIVSAVDTSTWNSELRYTAVMDLPKFFYKKQGKALLLGLGSGILLKQYSRERWLIEAVEPDEAVVRFARKYFGLRPPEGSVTVSDPVEYLSSKASRYNLILVDAFAGGGRLLPILTDKTFASLRDHLEADGVVAITLTANGWNDFFISRMIATLRRSFSNTFVLPIEEPPDRPGNLVLLAANQTLEPLREPERNDLFDPDWRFGVEYQKAHAWDNRFNPTIQGVPILTSGHDETGSLTEGSALALRKESHALFGADGLDW